MGIQIREFTKEDFSQLLMLSDDEWGNTISQIALSLKQNSGAIERCIVAENDGMIVGFIYGFVLPSKALIPEFMYVLPKWRKSGIGTKLLAFLEQTSGCYSSMIFYHNTYHDYYKKQGYLTGENIETAMKDLHTSQDEMK